MTTTAVYNQAIGQNTDGNLKLMKDAMLGVNSDGAKLTSGEKVAAILDAQDSQNTGNAARDFAKSVYQGVGSLGR
jgi:hypothetical protein